jgi:hypothetical protein
MKMLARLAEGWEQAGGAPPEVLHLARRADRARAAEAFAGADVVMLGMPLYVDSMPAPVLEWIAALGPLRAAHGPAPVLGFLVQSGFPEALHARPLQRYLEKLARRLGSPCAGTIVRGAGESLQMRPDRSNGRLWTRLRTLGGQLARDGRFGAAELSAMAGTERFRPVAAALVAVAFKVPLTQFYWNLQLRRNGARDRSFAAPYGPAAG